MSCFAMFLVFLPPSWFCITVGIFLQAPHYRSNPTREEPDRRHELWHRWQVDMEHALDRRHEIRHCKDYGMVDVNHHCQACRLSPLLPD